MKKLLLAVAVIPLLLIAALSFAADVPLGALSSPDAGVVLASPDGGTFCSDRLAPKQKYAAQCDAGMCLRTCVDGGTCAASCATDVKLTPGAMYDFVMPGIHNQVCVVTEFASTAGSCKLFSVEP